MLLRALFLFVLVLGGSAFGCTDKGNGGPGGSQTPPAKHQVAEGDSTLYAARADAAKQAGMPVLDVRLKSVRHAGWDGCMGVIIPGQACAELFGAGYIALFEADGHEYRYHLGGHTWIGPVDPAQASDGSPVPPLMRTDFLEVLSKYAREDWAARQKVDAKTVTIEAVLPQSLRGGDATPVATTPATAGADGFARVSILRQFSGDSQWYRLSADGVEQVANPGDSAAGDAPAAVEKIELAMRQDLANRLASPPAGGDAVQLVRQISVLSYHEVTWADGCLGVHESGKVCTQALVPGFFAHLAGPGGKVMRYHGANGQFIRADFGPGVYVEEPIGEP